MVQPKNRLTHPKIKIEYPEHQERRRYSHATIQITQPRQPSLTRFDFIMMSCSSTVWVPLVSLTNAMELVEVNNDDATISPIVHGEFVLSTNIGLERIGRINKKSLPLLQQPLSKLDFILKSNKEPLYYPEFMFGAWNVTAKLLRSIQIHMNNDNDMISMDTTTATTNETRIYHFQRQFFTTIANTIQNQITINLGTGIPETKVISNRANNLPSEIILIKNFIKTIPIYTTDIANMQWDYRSTTMPTRVSWDDIKNQQIRYELETIGYESEFESNQKVFAATEHNRIQVFDELKTLRSSIKTEMSTEYHKLSEGMVQARTRIIVMDSKTPKWMTVLDYDLSMHRTVQSFINRNNDRVTNRPCVETPMGIVQCY